MKIKFPLDFLFKKIKKRTSSNQSNRVCCFQTLDVVFPKDLFSDYIEKDEDVYVVLLFKTNLFLGESQETDI